MPELAQAYPPAQNQYMQKMFLEELIFAAIHVGPVFAIPRIQEIRLRNYFEICIHTFAPYLCMDIVAVFTHP